MYLGGTCTVCYRGEKADVIDQLVEAKLPFNLGGQKRSMWGENRQKESTLDEEAPSGISSYNGNEFYSLSTIDSTLDSSEIQSSKHQIHLRARHGWDDMDDLEEPDEALSKEPLVEMNGVQVRYGGRTILGGWKQKVENEQREGLWWNINRGERWALFGPNGMSDS